MKIDGAIFDMDGTLLDSMIVWDNIGEDYLKKMGKIAKPTLREDLRTLSIVQSAQLFIDEYGITDSPEKIMADINSMIEDAYRYEVPLKCGVAEYLQKLDKNGTKMCVATATDRHLVETALKRVGIYDCFRFVLTCTEVGSGKDSAEIFETALEKLGTQKEFTYVFEDALHAIETAKSAGFNVIGVYDQSADAFIEQIKNTVDFYTVNYDNI